jgi:DNA-binding LacI/PurR family transcriptional regulator
LTGYRDALQAAGIEENPDWVLEFPMIPTAKGYVDWGHSAMRTWLREGWLELGCTALLAQNDGTAIGAIQALREANVAVPQQFSVVGFDGTETFDYFSPQLTSVEIPLRQIGVVGTEALLASIWGRQVTNEETAVETIMLPTRIKEGQSAAPSPTLEMAR